MFKEVEGGYKHHSEITTEIDPLESGLQYESRPWQEAPVFYRDH